MAPRRAVARSPLPAACALALLGCGPELAAVPLPGPAAPGAGVSVCVTCDPAAWGAQLLDTLEAKEEQASLEGLLAELVPRAVSLGANVLQVESVSTTFALVPRVEPVSVSCGGFRMGRTCTDYRTVLAEVPTTLLRVRAFRSPR